MDLLVLFFSFYALKMAARACNQKLDYIKYNRKIKCPAFPKEKPTPISINLMEKVIINDYEGVFITVD